MFETNHKIKNTEVKIHLKQGRYPIQENARAIPYYLQQDIKKLDQKVNSTGHLEMRD